MPSHIHATIDISILLEDNQYLYTCHFHVTY